MSYEIHIKNSSNSGQIQVVTVDASHWHHALKHAFSEINQTVPSQLLFDISDDESFVVARDSHEGIVVEITDLSKKNTPFTHPIDNKATVIDSKAFGEDEAFASTMISSSVPSLPHLPDMESLEMTGEKKMVSNKAKTTSRYLAYDDENYEGMQYQTGMTTEILAEAFMRAMDIYDFKMDIHGAMKFILDLALTQLETSGGGILLANPLELSSPMWYEIAAGENSSLLKNTRVPVGQGAVGLCAREGVSFLVVDMNNDPRFSNDHLFGLKIDVGPLLCVPIQNEGNLLGAIQLYRKKGGATYTQGELSILNYLAHTASEYLLSLGAEALNAHASTHKS